MNLYKSFIFKTRYARYLENKKRRESWEETVDRYIDCIVTPKLGEHEPETAERLREAIFNMEVLPSMRGLMAAGKAIDRDNIALFNCSYIPVNCVEAIAETMHILMNGTGVGFSVERQDVSKLPVVLKDSGNHTTVIVEDSKEGWATALLEVLNALYAGDTISWDVTNVRPEGARLKTMGGRSSGPQPLVNLFTFVKETFNQVEEGTKLPSIAVHDIMCKVGEVVVVGGVRRSALISLSNLSDLRMRDAKTGAWWENNPQRALANNSVCYTEKPDMSTFLNEWTALYHSQSGERGFFNREAAKKQASKYGRRDSNYDFGTNPCSEIILRPFQFCNLTTIVVRPKDTPATLIEKAKLATILGTVQASYTNFKFLRKVWKENTEQEALLGVSMTGVLDNKILAEDSPERKALFETIRETTVKENAKYAELLGINPAGAITCIKPEGTASQLTDTASGLHARFAPYYIRRVRNSVNDPLSHFMIDCGVPYELDAVQKGTFVFSFPMKAPEGSIFTDDRTAIEQLDNWLQIQRQYCEHKPSITVYYSNAEFMDVGAWVWKHFDELSGVSFLPRSEHTYVQAPYEAITEKEYMELASTMPTGIEWERFTEEDDNTEAAQQLSCTAGVCEI